MFSYFINWLFNYNQLVNYIFKCWFTFWLVFSEWYDTFKFDKWYICKIFEGEYLKGFLKAFLFWAFPRSIGLPRQVWMKNLHKFLTFIEICADCSDCLYFYFHRFSGNDISTRPLAPASEFLKIWPSGKYILVFTCPNGQADFLNIKNIFLKEIAQIPWNIFKQFNKTEKKLVFKSSNTCLSSICVVTYFGQV